MSKISRVSFSTVLFVIAAAVAPQAMAKDACATLMCMGGQMMGGSGGSMCVSPIKDYFDIVKYRHNRPDLGKTIKARQEYLDQCKEDNSGQGKIINAKYGAVIGGM